MEEFLLDNRVHRVPYLEDNSHSSQLTILTIGNSGSGKSSLLNKLFDFELCTVNNCISQSGLVYQVVSGEGKAIQVVDTSGPFCEHNNSLSSTNASLIDNFMQAQNDNPLVLLYVIKATENRLRQGNFARTLKTLKNQNSLRSNYTNLIIVITHGLALGSEQKEYSRGLNTLTREISSIVDSVFEKINVPIIVVENCPQKYNFNEIFQLPDGKFPHVNLMETMLQTFQKTQSMIALKTLAWFKHNKCNENHVESTLGLQEHIDLQQGGNHRLRRRLNVSYRPSTSNQQSSCSNTAEKCNEAQTLVTEMHQQRSQDNAQEPLLSPLPRIQKFQAITRKMLVLAINCVMIALSITLAMYFISSKNGIFLESLLKEKSEPIHRDSHTNTNIVIELSTSSVSRFPLTVEPVGIRNVTDSTPHKQHNSFIASLTINLTENNDWVFKASHQNFINIVDLNIVGKFQQAQIGRVLAKFVNIRRLTLNIEAEDESNPSIQNINTFFGDQKIQLYFLTSLNIETDHPCGIVLKTIAESVEFPALQSFAYEKGVINDDTCAHIKALVTSHDSLSALSFSKSEWHTNCFEVTNKPLKQILELKVDMLYGTNSTTSNFQNALMVFPHLKKLQSDFGYVSWDEVCHLNITNRIEYLKLNVKLPQGRHEIDISEFRIAFPELRSLQISIFFHRQRERKLCQIFGYLFMEKTLNVFNVMSNCQTQKL